MIEVFVVETATGFAVPLVADAPSTVIVSL
jgi:hypothetical protein